MAIKRIVLSVVVVFVLVLPATSTADSVDVGFNPNASDEVHSIALQADGKILVGGDFTTIGGQPRNYIARLNPDGSLDATFNANANRTVHSIAVQADGKILVGGDFTTIGGQPRISITRLNQDGSADMTFDRNAGANVNIGGYSNPSVISIAVQADGKILMGLIIYPKLFSGQPFARIARLNADGTVDTTFNSHVGGNLCPGIPCGVGFAMQADGRILMGGRFTSIGGQARNHIARLNQDSSLDLTFDPNATDIVFSLAEQADGKILVGGFFTQIGGQTRNTIARLNQDGTLDTTFTPNGNGSVYCLAVQADGRILIGGNFTSIDGQTRTRIARLNADGSLDATFIPGADGPVNTFIIVNTLTIQADGKILVGGEFATIGGQVRNRIARLSADEAALQELVASSDGTAITWMRSQSSPELYDVTFEQSLDTATWTALGQATRIPGGWQLSGLTLPADTIYHVRARGRASGGYFNSSTSLMESVMQWYGSTYPLIQELISNHYRNVLDRDPDQGGWDFWTSEIERIVSLGIDIGEGYQALARVFFNSTEYLLRERSDEEFVTDLYETFLGRLPDDPGKVHWVNQLLAGLTRDMLITEFANSDEFKLYLQGILGIMSTRPENNLVNDLYRGFLGRLPDSEGFNWWLKDNPSMNMRTAQCSGAAAVRSLTDQIALAFIQSNEYTNRQRSNNQYVEDLYNGILKRGADPAGYIHWVTFLNNDTYNRVQMLSEFTNSPEFQTRVQQVIDAGCLP